MDVQGKHVLVVGLARSGLSVAHALARRGALVTVTDLKPPAEFREALPQLIKDKVGLELGSQRVETFLRHEVIVISPGVRWDLPQLQAARERKIPIYPEVEAAGWFLDGTLVGVTGSNGKTTTTALLGDMLKASGFPTFVGGNIGNALSSAVDHAPPGTKFVTELSSFQLEGVHDFRAHVAVMLNLSPNHLDRHPNLEAYSQAKRQIFRNQGGQDYAVLNADDPWVAGLQATVSSRPVLFSRHRELASGVFVSGGKIYYRVRHLERVLFETRDVTLRGDFNLENVLAATTAACVLGADFAAIRKAVRAFQAVEHRLEFVREIQGVDFYNNSKATSVDATVKSLEAFERGVHLILGGKDKGAPYTPLIPLIKERVREVLLIGAAAPVIAQQLAGSTDLVQAGDLATAVYQAFARSRPGDTVLLAPACSSFDQFKDYEERGRAFKELVKRLANDVRTRETGHGTRDTGDGTTRDTGEAVRDGGTVPEVGRKTRETADAVRDAGRETGDKGLSTRDSESGIRDSASAQSVNPEPATPTPESQVATPEPQIPTPESQAPTPEPVASSSESEVLSPVSRVPCTVSRVVPSPESRIPLTYVYEVDAVEMPELESPVVPEDEPAISISASRAETLEDEALPYEARPAVGNSGAPSPESEVQAPESEALPGSRQPRLPGVE
jgi:UDP-N-acetylmuramoylalanine--D-glutamate ligase